MENSKFKHYEKVIHQYLLKHNILNKEDREDICQTVLMNFVRSKTFKEVHESATVGYLLRAAHNTMINEYRKAKNNPLKGKIADMDTGDSGDFIDYKLFNSGAYSKINKNLDFPKPILVALEKVPYSDYLVKFLEGYSYNDLVEMKGEKLGTVKSRIFFVKRNLRNLLENYALEEWGIEEK